FRQNEGKFVVRITSDEVNLAATGTKNSSQTLHQTAPVQTRVAVDRFLNGCQAVHRGQKQTARVFEPVGTINFVRQQKVKVTVGKEARLRVKTLNLHLVLLDAKLALQDSLVHQTIHGFPDLLHNKG